jgi:hypothetical protein
MPGGLTILLAVVVMAALLLGWCLAGRRSRR